MATVLPKFTGATYSVSKTPATPLAVAAFNPTKDVIELEGAYGDYTFTPTASSVEVRTKGNNALVATINGTTKIDPFTGTSPTGKAYALSTQNEFFTTNVKPFFNVAAYLALPTNTDVPGLIASGQFADPWDHYLRAGQFESRREDTFLTGTNKNDKLYGVGDETVVTGVQVDKAVYSGGADIKPLSLGVGEQDTIIGSPGENIILLGNGNRYGGTPTMFYVGKGNQDYARIQNYDPITDLIDVPGVYTDYFGRDAKYKLEVKNGDTHLSTRNGDLVAIIEDTSDLTPFSGGRNDTGVAQLRSL
jgi:hypothetical protein